MNQSKKSLREEIKRMKASMKDLQKQETGVFKDGRFIQKTKRKPNLNLCMKCKQDAGRNFILIYKKNNELKGKLCTSCSTQLPQELCRKTTQ